MEAQLKEKLSKNKYSYKKEVKKDILNVVVNFKDLRPECGTLKASGKEITLVCLEGTIPVNYRGVFYNMPIRIGIRRDHPRSPPVCFVKPTQDMSIRASKQVDCSGLISLPYLSEWKPASSDLSELIQIMCIEFGEQPPVYIPRNFQQQNPVGNAWPPRALRAAQSPLTQGCPPSPPPVVNRRLPPLSSAAAGYPPRWCPPYQQGPRPMNYRPPNTVPQNAWQNTGTTDGNDPLRTDALKEQVIQLTKELDLLARERNYLKQQLTDEKESKLALQKQLNDEIRRLQNEIQHLQGDSQKLQEDQQLHLSWVSTLRQQLHNSDQELTALKNRHSTVQKAYKQCVSKTQLQPYNISADDVTVLGDQLGGGSYGGKHWSESTINLIYSACRPYI